MKKENTLTEIFINNKDVAWLNFNLKYNPDGKHCYRKWVEDRNVCSSSFTTKVINNKYHNLLSNLWWDELEWVISKLEHM